MKQIKYVLFLFLFLLLIVISCKSTMTDDRENTGSTAPKSEISFDYDLGGHQQNGFWVAKWIEFLAYHKKIDPLKWEIHSKDKFGKDVASGVFYYVLQTGEIIKSKKMSLLK